MLKIIVDKTSYVDGEEKFLSCDTLYPLGVTKEIVINNDKIINNTIPKVTQKIVGNVRWFGWPAFDDYSIASVNKFSNFISLLEKSQIFCY